MKRLPFLLAPLLLAACAPQETGPAAAVPAAATDWHGVATDFDRERMRKWRTAWVPEIGRASCRERV